MLSFDEWQDKKCARYYSRVDNAACAYSLARRYGEPESELKIYFEELQKAEKALERAQNRYSYEAYCRLFD